MNVAAPADIVNALDLTDEQRQALRDSQAKALQKFRSKAKLTPAEQTLGLGIQLEQHHRLTGNQNALAEALAMQGRFREAVNTATDPALKARLLEKAEAIESPDDDCECPTYTQMDDLQIPNQFVEARVLTRRGLLPAIRCQVCRRLNVRPELPHLAEQHAARQQSVAGKEVKATDFFRKK